MEINPFVVAGKIPNEYFCDRKVEIGKVTKGIDNQENIVIISPRRMGKSELINYCFSQKRIAEEYNTLVIEILHTTSLRELTMELGNAIYRKIAKRSDKLFKIFSATLRSLSASFGFDPVLNTPTFGIKLGDIESPEYTLDEIFEYIEKTDKRCIIAIDEFQQIVNYPEKNTEAILRSRIQKMTNANFIYSGSERHIVEEMFMSSKRPFYQSATVIQLKAIEKETYRQFVISNFEKRGKTINPECIDRIYDKVKGVTMYMQRVFHDAFTMETDGGEGDLELVDKLLDNYMEENSSRLSQQLSMLNEAQKELIYAIHHDGIATAITSSSFIKRHKLRSASSVQAAAKKLLEYDIITRTAGDYSLSDPLLTMWMDKNI